VEQKFVLQALKDQGVQDKYVIIIRNTQNNSYVKIKCQFVVENFRVEKESNIVIQLYQNSLFLHRAF